MLDRDLFKTSAQCAFYRRHHENLKTESNFYILSHTIDIKPHGFSAHILEVENVLDQQPLQLDISLLQDNIVRLKIAGINELKERFNIPVGVALSNEPNPEKCTLIKKTDENIVFGNKNFQLVCHFKPFWVSLCDDGLEVISCNKKQPLKFERYRERKAEDDEGMWEEMFHGQQDTKPYGPSSVGMSICFQQFEHIYGIPERTSSLSLKSTEEMNDSYRLYNLDVYEHELHSPMALYGSVPLAIAHNEKRTVAAFWHNCSETWVDVEKVVNTEDETEPSACKYSKLDQLPTLPHINTHWVSEAGIIDVFFLLGPSPQNIFRQYAALTGSTPLPPLFALGYHQCRMDYGSEEDVKMVDTGCDEHSIPLDVIWLDMNHTDNRKYFTWDVTKFPDPKNTLNTLQVKGRKMVNIIDPHVKKEDGYYLYEDCKKNGFFVKSSSGAEYEGICWPEACGWIDYLNPDAREYWSKQFLLENYPGSTCDLFTWNDMNEPSVFKSPEMTMPKDNLHYGNWEHREIHNIYGLLEVKATANGQLARTGGRERPFILTRSFFAGSQRYAAVWTGDNSATWGFLKITLPMLMTLNITGITFSGADVGGYAGDPSPELLTRWYQAGAYQPFFRAHAHWDSIRREPWVMPKENLEAMREAVRARYSLLPYWYTLFYLSETSGQPIMRPLWTEFPRDKIGFAMEDQYLIGPALLVHPVTDSQVSQVRVYFPSSEEVWYDVNTYKCYDGGRHALIDVDLMSVPVFQRGGYIVPRWNSIGGSSAQMHSNPYLLVAMLDRKGEANGELYIDDFHSFNYKLSFFIHRQFIFANNELRNIKTPSSQICNGDFKTNAYFNEIRLCGFNKQPSEAEFKNGVITTKLSIKYDELTQVLILQNVNLQFDEDWTITVA